MSMHNLGISVTIAEQYLIILISVRLENKMSMFVKNITMSVSLLKLVRTLLNHRVIETSTAAIFFSNGHYLKHLYTSDERHAWFHW